MLNFLEFIKSWLIGFSPEKILKYFRDLSLKSKETSKVPSAIKRTEAFVSKVVLPGCFVSRPVSRKKKHSNAVWFFSSFSFLFFRKFKFPAKSDFWRIATASKLHIWIPLFLKAVFRPIKINEKFGLKFGKEISK